MAYFQQAKPGAPYGPCFNERCAHRDCAASRALVVLPCAICKSDIGYDRNYYIYETNDGRISDAAHASCVHDEQAKAEEAKERNTNGN